jgi:tripartite-type tricarboxylate transporter receptor subunit TctC
MGECLLLTRREAVTASGGGIAGYAASAQGSHPGKTIKLIVPYPAGGMTDLLGRMIAEQLRSGLAGSTPDSFAAYIKNEVHRWTGIVKQSGATPE